MTPRVKLGGSLILSPTARTLAAVLRLSESEATQKTDEVAAQALALHEEMKRRARASRGGR